MKQRWLGLSALLLTLAIGAHGFSAQERDREAGGNDKTIAVGKDGVKIDGNIANDDPKVPFFLGEKKLLDMASKMYQVKLKAGKKYTLTMDSKELDSFIILQAKTGKQLAFDDDSGGNLNARLVYNATKDGTYKVYAASLTGTGAFVLKITEAAGAVAADPKKIYEVDKKGLFIEGNLSKEARNITFQVKLVEGKSYKIDLKSKQFDAYLYLHDSNGNKLAEDDDGGDELNSRIIHKAASSGTYRIMTSSLGMAGTGDFTLEVRAQE